MLSIIRDRMGKYFVGAIVGAIALVFVLSDLLQPRSTRGMHEGSVAGTVNGDSISLGEFNRAYQQRIEMFKNFGGGKISEDQLKMFKVKESVFKELVNRRLMIQEAVRWGRLASDEEVRTKIREYPAFQKEGRFDTVTYRRVLEANNLTPGSFEKMIRDDASVQGMSEYLRDSVRVSSEEVRREFIVTQDKRNIKYVVVSREAVKKSMPAPAPGKDGKPGEINPADLEKAVDELAKKVAGSLAVSKASDGAVAALVKPYGLEIKSTGQISRQNPFIPGIGESKDLLKDAFSKLDAAKTYRVAAGVVVAVVTESVAPDLSKLDSQREQLERQVASRKEREITDAWMKKLSDHSKIVPNPDVVNST